MVSDPDDDDMFGDENKSVQQDKAQSKRPRQGSGKLTPQVPPDLLPPDAQHIDLTTDTLPAEFQAAEKEIQKRLSARAGIDAGINEA